MKMHWVHCSLLFLVTHSVVSQVEDVEINNEVSATPPTTDLNSNLRKALLKALTELESEEAKISDFQNFENKDRNIEKASAASVSIFSNGESFNSLTSSTTTTTTEIPENSLVVLQKSQGVQHQSISSFEKVTNDPEQILTSATSSFTNLPLEKTSHEAKFPQPNSNSIESFDNSTIRIETSESTTLATSVSTEENEAKVEDVQFFSAPLVAAFTVHQDELGLPKKVEPIYRSAQTQRIEEEVNTRRVEAVRKEQERIKLEEIRKQQEKIQQQFQLEQNKKNLEQEILRLNLNLKQQQNLFLRQQEELRNRANSQQFLPFINPTINVERPLSNQQLPVRSANQFNPSVALQPSISFDPLVEAGKLPQNAQILPIKGPVNFQTPFVQNQFDNFGQQTQGNRFFRQNTGVGNLGVNSDFNRNTNSFSIQQSFQPGFETLAQGNRFLRSNLESSFTAPQFLQAPQPQSNRFFRSNLESTFVAPSNNIQYSQGNYNNQHLSNLLYNSGAFRGKSPEDLSLISKVLSYNNNFGNSLRQQQQYSVRNF